MIQFTLRAIPQVTFDLGDQELCREAVSAIVDHEVGTGIVYFFKIFLGLAVNPVVVIIFKFQELKNRLR
jgi:hypothetical protein